MAYPTDEHIRVRAHELWEQAGKPEGQDEAFWHLAERDLQEQEQSGNSQSAIVPE